MGLLDRFKHSLAKTRAVIVGRFVSPQWSAEEMERALIESDFGPRLAADIVTGVRKRLELNPRATREEAAAAARAEIQGIFAPSRPASSDARPRVILMVGVNGTGKTTTTAKLAGRFKREGGRVMLVAADTFRAAAVEQLQVWGKRLGVEVVAGNPGADAASVAHDALRRAEREGCTQLLVDTAGRQHTKSNLMQELQKVKRVLAKAMVGAPHETWLVVDAPTGGNALSQVREFHEAMQLTGVIITKLDGSARGGVVAAIARESRLPVLYAGLGEGVDDIEPFDAAIFSEALFPGEVKN